MLCNIGAAELLMPIATFPALREKALKINSLMELRKQFQVSSEALLLRVVNLSLEACAVFAASVVTKALLFGSTGLITLFLRVLGTRS